MYELCLSPAVVVLLYAVRAVAILILPGCILQESGGLESSSANTMLYEHLSIALEIVAATSTNLTE
jgi:hypothetical protein